MVARTICQVLAGAESGGLERHFVDLCNALGERHHVTAIAHPMHATALIGRVRFVALDVAGSRFNPLLLRKLYLALLEAAPDLVHTHANKATAMVGLLKPWLSMSFVATLHNAKSRVSMFRNCDGVIAVSRSVASCLPRRQVTVIPNGIAPPPAVAPDELAGVKASVTQRPLVLAAGRLVEAKGFDVLLKSWRTLAAQLWIAGEGPQRPRLEAQIRDQRLEDRVRLLGHRDDLGVLMAAADLLVMPSRNEGFPYVLLEALHHRLPVVATRVAGAVDTVPEPWLVPADDAAALAAAVSRALAAPAQLREDFAPVWDYAQRELTLQAMVTRTEDFYREVLRG